MIDLSTTRMISVREVADIDAETLALYEQQEALLRDGSGFLLYLLRRDSNRLNRGETDASRRPRGAGLAQ